MLSNAFLLARPCALRKSGAIEDLEGAETEFVPGQPLVLSRAFCRFEFFKPPSSLSRTDQARAARLRGELAAPFPDSGVTLVRQNAGIGIWYWDRGRVSQILPGLSSEKSRAVPETVLRAPGDGWRIVACLDGYEAQLWEEGALIASMWRREAFTDAHWAAFVLSTGETRMPAPDTPPPMTFAPWRLDGPWRQDLVAEPLTWRDAERALLAIAAASVLFSSVCLGQAAHGVNEARAAQAAIAEARGGASSNQVRLQEGALETFNSVVGATGIVATALDAFEVFKILRIEAQEWTIDQNRFEARIEIPAEGGSLTGVAQALEEAPGLRGVSMDLADGRDGQYLDVRAQVVRSGTRP